MKKVAYMVENQKSIWGVTIRVLDREAIDVVLVSKYTGFTLDDAVRNANKKLNGLGFEVCEKITDDAEILKRMEMW